jgi:hypothetical protein
MSDSYPFPVKKVFKKYLPCFAALVLNSSTMGRLLAAQASKLNSLEAVLRIRIRPDPDVWGSGSRP